MVRINLNFRYIFELYTNNKTIPNMENINNLFIFW